jgi:hypothetical protein
VNLLNLDQLTLQLAYMKISLDLLEKKVFNIEHSHSNYLLTMEEIYLTISAFDSLEVLLKKTNVNHMKPFLKQA